MLKAKLEGEELKKIRAGRPMCCWEPGMGCRCVDGDNFETMFQGWLDIMDAELEGGG